MGVIENRVDEIFNDFDNHHDYHKLIEALIKGNYYAWGWQRDAFNNNVKKRLESLKNKT